MPRTGEIMHTEGLLHLASITKNSAYTRIGGATGSHVDEIARNVGGIDSVFLNKTEGVLEIGSGADGGFERAVLFVATATTVKSRVRRHPTGLEKPGCKGAPFPTADDFTIGIDEE